MISKVYFPRLIVPLASIGVSVVDFAISFILLIIIMMFYSMLPNWQILYFPLLIAGLMLTAMGVSCWLSAITVSYRDFRFVIPFMVQIWMYITPVNNTLSFIPPDWQWLAHLNPVFGWVEGIRASILGGTKNWASIAISASWMLIILGLGLRYFERSELRFADVI